MFGPEGVNGLHVLDLYAGTGGFGLAALRRGAARVVMVEKDHRRADRLKAEVAGDQALSAGEVIAGDAIGSMRRLDVPNGKFDVVFADPPYADDPFKLLAEQLAECELLADGGTVFLEHFHKTELPERLAGLVMTTRRRYGDTAISVYRSKTQAGPNGGEPEKSW